MIEYLDSEQFKKMFLSGAAAINENKDLINELNVFPVPDGDTGTNMSMTIMSAALEVNKLNEPDFKTLAEGMAVGSLKGARGNSGVILSQILRGMSKVIKHESRIDTMIMAQALKKGCDTAYKAVMRPKEGTILTVINEASAFAVENAEFITDMDEFLDAVLKIAKASLDNTPNLLPILKQAGVVDSGGTGLVTFLNGMLLGLRGEEIKLDLSLYSAKVKPNINADNEADNIEFGYCTEMIVMLKEKVASPRLNDFRDYLETLGDSLVFVPDSSFIKLHVHTNNPDKVISKALTFGELTGIKIDNMREEHREILFKKGENGVYVENDRTGFTTGEAALNPSIKLKDDGKLKKTGFIAVSSGTGFSTLFKDLGCDEIIEGGQTMNPSTEDILDRIDRISAENIFVFPNNKNIVLACNQARDMTENKKVTVIPSTTLPQGVAAMMCYTGDDSLDIDTLRNEMYDAVKRIKSYSLTYAVRDTDIDKVEIKKGDIMVIGDNGIVSASPSIISAMGSLLQDAVDEYSGFISIYRGKDVDDSMDAAIVEFVKANYPDIEIDFYFGGQPVYYYVVSVE